MVRPNKREVNKFMSNLIVRNLILFVSLLVIFLFVMQLMLGIFTRHGRHKEVPDFTGVKIEDARKLARRHGHLRIEVSDSLYVPVNEGGVILEQKPEAGTEVKAGRRIFVTINSYNQKMVDVPYVTGFSLRQAKNNIENAGLEIESLEYVDDIATNYVLSERMDGREVHQGSELKAEIGSGVTLVVGRSADSHTIVPKVVGISLREAKSRLWEQGLNVGKVVFDDDINAINQRNAKVFVQEPGQAHSVQLGSRVNLELTLDQQKVDHHVKLSDDAAKSLIEERMNAEKDGEEGVDGEDGATADDDFFSF